MAGSASATADGPSDPYSVLHTRTFNLGGVGFAGTISPGERYLFEVISLPDAVRQLEFTFANGSIAAKCYALCGLRIVAPERFEERARQFALSGEVVAVDYGCVRNPHTAADVARAITDGWAYRYLGSKLMPR